MLAQQCLGEQLVANVWADRMEAMKTDSGMCRMLKSVMVKSFAQRFPETWQPRITR